MRNAYKIMVRKFEGKNHSEDLGGDGRIIFQWIFGKSGLVVWIEIHPAQGYGLVAVSCEHGNEPSVSIKCGEFLD
jgi:hypothetical protein